MSSRYEKEIIQRLESKGYTVLTKGWPDFLAYRMTENGRPEVRLVEAKATNDTLRASQKELHHILSDFGIPVEVMWEGGFPAEIAKAADKAIAECFERLGEESFPIFSALGKVGGASKSDAKVHASRENGKLGGRPRKQLEVNVGG